MRGQITYIMALKGWDDLEERCVRPDITDSKPVIMSIKAGQEQRMIEQKELLSIRYYAKGKPFTGSDSGIRYRIAKISVEGEEEGKKEELFLVSVWPEPYCYEKADRKSMIERTFPYGKESFESLADYLNETGDLIRRDI